MRQTSVSHRSSSLRAVALLRSTFRDHRDAPLSLRSPYVSLSATLVSFSCGLVRTCVAFRWNASCLIATTLRPSIPPPRLYAFPIVATFRYRFPPSFELQLVPASRQLSQHDQTSAYLSQTLGYRRGSSSSRTSRPLRTSTTPSIFVAKSSGGSDLWFRSTSSFFLFYDITYDDVLPLGRPPFVFLFYFQPFPSVAPCGI